MRRFQEAAAAKHDPRPFKDAHFTDTSDPAHSQIG